MITFQCLRLIANEHIEIIYHNASTLAAVVAPPDQDSAFGREI